MGQTAHKTKSEWGAEHSAFKLMGASPHHHGVGVFRDARRLFGFRNPAPGQSPLGKAVRTDDAHAETASRRATAALVRTFTVLLGSGRIALSALAAIVDFLLFLPLAPIIGLRRQDQTLDPPAVDEAAASRPQAAAVPFEPNGPPAPRSAPKSAND